MADYEKVILLTGGAGFIGSHLVKHFVQKYKQYKIVNLDALTYAGNLESLREVEDEPNYHFVKGDICDNELVNDLFVLHGITHVLHCAAESHVDRSITNPMAFVQTNVIGTVTLLNAAKYHWQDPKAHLFYHVSTDEVYGALGDTGLFTERTSYEPHSPYSASKASSDHFVRAYADTYKLPIVISNCSNNYGPFQFPEKLLPLCINNIVNNKPLPVYGKGENVRDWLHVQDHVEAIDKIFHEAKLGETYNVGGHNEWKNIDVVRLLCKILDNKLNRPEGTNEQLITFVTDRAGHDLRYAIDASKIANELGWKPSFKFEQGLEQTVDWYLANTEWLTNITSGNYKDYYEKQYSR
jgi:dTDP-glucose 4,6-dehydratase